MAAALRYPLGKLNETSDFLQIGIVDYTPIGKLAASQTTQAYGVGSAPGAVRETINRVGIVKPGSNRKNKNKTLLETILLPIPSNIQDGNSISFGPSSLDGLTGSVANQALSAFEKTRIDDISKAGENVTTVLQGLTSTILSGEALTYFNNTLAAQAANIPFGGNLTASQLLARQTGQILNPNMELLFEGVNLRSFKFSFKLTPRGPQEAATVKDIIRTLKKNMCPSGENSLYLETPNIFELTYKKGSGDHPFLHKFKQCALTDMSVNYTGEGVYATYGGSDKDGGGTPVSMIMDLGFKELEPIYSGDYEDSDTSVGF
jgi:hypothetical protein